MGITFAILNWDGTTPVLRDNLRTWKRGFTITEIVCLIKFEDTPVWSGVFFIQQEFSGLQNLFLRQVFVAKSKTIQASRILVRYVYIADCFGCNFTKKFVKVTGHWELILNVQAIYC